MEKQHNRGQDGAGVANIKFDVEQGSRYISRHRSVGARPIQDVFEYINSKFNEVREKEPEKIKDPLWLKTRFGFTGELWLGHLRYGTYGGNTVEACHPILRQNNWMTRNLALAGNFNLTNVDELFDLLVSLGQHPKEKSDTVTVLEKIGHFLDEENERLFRKYKKEGHSKKEISGLIAKGLNIRRILSRSAEDWDGGYVMAGMIGHGDAFVIRDPSGIRPAYYYHDDEIAVVTSERPPIQTAFNVKLDAIKEIHPGHALVIKKNGDVTEEKVCKSMKKKSCSFERIYFSRGNDADIYKERKALGRSICKQVINAVDKDLRNTVFSFIPNTAETAFYGMVDGMNDYLNKVKRNKIKALKSSYKEDELEQILSIKPRIEKIAIKDAKMRTFITEDSARNDLVKHVYDITYDTVNEGVDNLVVIDDSIVRGTTLKESILEMLDRLNPKKIVIVSSAPQIRYPDCYGIDMAKLGDFIAFNAAVELLKESGQKNVLNEVYEKAKKQEKLPKHKITNQVKAIYSPFTADQISDKIATLLKPADIKAEVQIIYQKLEGLHKACPNHKGDWYFSGDYPTPGGNKVVNRSFVNFMDGKNERAY